MTVSMIFDFGTTSLKVALCSEGVIRAERNGDYSVAKLSSGCSEQDPLELWNTAGRLSRELVAEHGAAGQVEHVVFIAPWKGLIPVSENGGVLHPAIIWLDSRAGKQATQLNSVLASHGSPVRLTGQDYLARVAWFKENQPKAWSDARWIMGMCTFIKYMATGVVITEPSDDFVHHNHIPITTGGTHENLVSSVLTPVETAKFPSSFPPEHVIGSLTPAAGAHLGLTGSAQVINGFGDLPAITAGVGPVVDGAMHLYIGTSSWVGRVTTHGAESAGEAPASFTFDKQTQVELYPLQTGAMAFDWIVEELYGHERAHLSTRFLDHVNDLVDQVPAGSDNLLATHWLNGEIAPFSPQARGVFINLNTTHHKQHMVRAMMESLCYSHRLSIDTIDSRFQTRSESIRVVGGGATSPVWMQMLADVLGRDVLVPPNPRYTGVIGGLRCVDVALTGSGFSYSPKPDSSEATVYQPSGGATAQVYDRLYSTYKKLYPALATIFMELNNETSEEYTPS